MTTQPTPLPPSVDVAELRWMIQLKCAPEVMHLVDELCRRADPAPVADEAAIEAWERDWDAATRTLHFRIQRDEFDGVRAMGARAVRLMRAAPRNDDKLRQALVDWTHRYGSELVPPSGRSDTYGEGMRDAKDWVRKLLAESPAGEWVEKAHCDTIEGALKETETQLADCREAARAEAAERRAAEAERNWRSVSDKLVDSWAERESLSGALKRRNLEFDDIAKLRAAKPAPTSERVQKLRDLLMSSVLTQAAQAGIDELCELASNPILVRVAEPAAQEPPADEKSQCLTTKSSIVEGAAKTSQSRSPMTHQETTSTSAQEPNSVPSAQPASIAETLVTTSKRLEEVYIVLGQITLALKASGWTVPQDVAILVRGRIAQHEQDRRMMQKVIDDYKSDVAELNQHLAAAREERDKAQFSARQFCGAHVGQKFDRCPVCYGKDIRQQLAAARAEAGKMAVEELRNVQAQCERAAGCAPTWKPSGWSFADTVRHCAMRIAALESQAKPESAQEPVWSEPNDHTKNVCAIRRRSDGYWWQCDSEHGAGWNDKRIRQAWTAREARLEVERHLQGQDVEIVQLMPEPKPEAAAATDAEREGDAVLSRWLALDKSLTQLEWLASMSVVVDELCRRALRGEGR